MLTLPSAGLFHAGNSYRLSFNTRLFTMSKIQTARKLTRQAGAAASMADCLVCVSQRTLAFSKAEALLNQAQAVMPSRLR